MASYPAYGGQQAFNEFPYPPNSTTTFKTPEDDRRISRTPSPTPSEAEELSKPNVIDWKTYANVKFWIRKEWTLYYIIALVLVIITALITIYHDQIVKALTPAANWMHKLPGGWAIPIAVLFILSFPPLFGHEIVAILCGVVWGLWIGFAIVAAGTILGELGNFYAFKYCCRARSEKLEKTKITYACLARVVREGGFKIALIARLSAIPGHFTTAIFATCGMNVFIFLLAATLSSPKQFITVLLGVMLEDSDKGSSPASKKNKIISDVVLAITILITLGAMWYLLRELNKVKVDVIYQRRKARQNKIANANFNPYSNAGASSSTAFNPHGSDSDIPLRSSSDTPYEASPYQQWDTNGHAVGYSGDPRLYAPKPQHPQSDSPARIPTFRTDSGGGYNATGRRYDDSPGNQESSDSLGWHGTAQALPPGITHTPPQNQYQSPRIPPPAENTSYAPSPTPTQAQFATAAHTPTHDITSPMLPTPTYHGTPPAQPRFAPPSSPPPPSYRVV